MSNHNLASGARADRNWLWAALACHLGRLPLQGSHPSLNHRIKAGARDFHDMLTKGNFSGMVSDLDQIKGTGVTLDMVVAAFETLPDKQGDINDVFKAVESLFGPRGVLNNGAASRSTDKHKRWQSGVDSIISHSDLFGKTGRRGKYIYTLRDTPAIERPQKRRKVSCEAKNAMNKARAFGQLAGR